MIIRNARVSARMVAITLRFTVCSCLYRETECHFGSAERRPAQRPSLAVIRPNTGLCDTCEDESPSRVSAAGLSACSAIKQEGSLSRDATTAAPHDGLRITTNALAVRRAAAAALRPHNSQRQSKGSSKGSTSRRHRRPTKNVLSRRPRDHPRSRSTPAACPERRPRAPTARRPRPTASSWMASGASGSTASLHQYKKRT